MSDNIDREELAHFDQLAHRWWDQQGALKSLHHINPTRLRYVDERCALESRKVLDVGCGGGILSEAMAALGAVVTGIDASAGAVGVARLHGMESNVQVDYQVTTAENHATVFAGHYDSVTCMELLEHVPDPESVVHACSQLVRAGGHIFFSTINRTPMAWLSAIVGAEYILGLIPKGTHDYQKLIRPSELVQWGRANQLTLEGLDGMGYNPLSGNTTISRDVRVNYLLWMTRKDCPTKP